MRRLCISLLALAVSTAAYADGKPNIVLLFADNFGYGELGSYGGGNTRGAPTPRLDALAREGTRLTNFNVEPSCTPSRSALVVGRHPIRDGTFSVPVDGKPYGLVQWEITLPKLLSKAGYATALYGKWHLGDSDGRYPNDQGFDEWYGIPNSSVESFWPQEPIFDPKFALYEYVMEGRRGEKTHQVKLYDADARREIDNEVTDRTIDFMQRSVKAGKPFFAYVPFTQPHMPTEASKAFTGKTGNGPFADMLAEMDADSGRILDTVSALGIANDTIVIFSSDNGPEETIPWSAGRARGQALTSLRWKARCACRSSSAGRARFPPIASATRSCTSSTSTRRSPELPERRSRPIGRSTASTRATSCSASRRNRRANGSRSSRPAAPRARPTSTQ